MKTTYTIEEIPKVNEDLFEEIIRRSAEIKEWSSLNLESRPEEFNQIVDQVEEFICGLEACSSQLQDVPVDKYNWFNETAIKWQLVLSSIFRIQRRINISRPKRVLPPSIENRRILRQVPFSKSELEEWIEVKAYNVSKDRRIAFLGEKLQENEDPLDYIFRKIFVSSESEIQEDGYTARVSLASEILDGKISFVRQLNSECYNLSLESRWLKEVKKIKAYYNSRSRGNIYGSIIQEDYYKACDQINQVLKGLADPDIKASSEDFIEMRSYIENHYLTEGKIDSLDSHRGGKLISEKSGHIEKNTRHLIKPNESIEYINKRNWRWAETFVKSFYENIIKAVEDNDIESAAMVLSAFQIQEVLPEGYSILHENHDLITNCFEAAIVIYFFKPEMLQDFKGI